MPLTVDVIAEGVLDDLWTWAAQRATDTGVSVAEVVNRALEAERRRVTGAPRLDPRTKLVGRKGAGSHMAEGEYLGSDVAERAGLDGGTISRLTAVGVLRPEGGGGRGHPYAYTDVDVCLARVARLLTGTRDGSPLVHAADQLRATWPRTRDLFVVLVPDGAAALIGREGLAGVLKRQPCAHVASVEAVWNGLARATVAA